MPRTQYAKRASVDIAYQVLGQGPPDLVLVSPWLSHLEARWDIPEWEYLYDRFADFSRFIAFDKHGMGLSDPVSPDSLPTLEEWADDVLAVMDTVGSREAALLGIADGGTMATLFAATHPERVRSLVLLNSAARVSWAPDYPIGIPLQRQEAILSSIEQAWGDPQIVRQIAAKADAAMLEVWARQVRLAASPAMGRAIFHMLFGIDVRSVLASVQAPTLVLTSYSPLLSREHSQYLAEHIPHARFMELPPSIPQPTMADMDKLADAIEDFVSGVRGSVSTERILTTVLFSDIVGSTQRLAQVGDRQWREMLNVHDRLAEQQIARYRGRLIDRTGDGLVAIFDGPARAIQCGLALRDEVRRLGIQIRVGLHTGEVEMRGSLVAGLTVHIAARVMAAAGPGEILVSRTVREIVAGSTFAFEDRGVHQLKGVPDDWRLYSVQR